MRLLVTGGTGFLGRAIVDRLVGDSMVERLCVLSRDEHKVRALADRYVEPNPLRWFVGDVRDRDRLRLACQGVDAVIHAAALKRIDAVVNESVELDKTNVQGTLNVLHAALECGVRKVLFVSSDKACMPCNAYGASKMMAEHHTVGFNAYSMPRGMACSVVRYGNVFGSTGSILGIWQRNAAAGRKLPLTDRRMTRFHIRIDEAVQFCLSSLSRMVGGEIFVPDLPAFRLVDLAEAIGGEIVTVGLRPGGEKLHETMLSHEEPGRTLLQGDRYVVTPAHKSWSSNMYKGEKLEVDPRLSSDCQERWMTVEALRAEIVKVPIVA